MGNRGHCWHRASDICTLQFPPSHQEVCCYCGQTRTVAMRANPEGHGKHYPAGAMEPYKTPVKPCLRTRGRARRPEAP